MAKKIVLDIVFKAMSLNYDQGAGNYQELKKITRYDGKQYTLVSRYAIRYSLLKTLKEAGLDIELPGNKLNKSGNNNSTVLQPDPKCLIDGTIFQYPELDLFGYLVTETKPQNARESCVKISHAVSMTPYSYDNHFCANLGLANRYLKAHGGNLEPNPYNIEEHETFYQYTIVIDVDRIGEVEVYLSKEEKKKKKEDKEEKKNDELEIELDGRKFKVEVIRDNESLKDNTEKIILKVKEIEEYRKLVIEKLLKAIFSLKREIKGRCENLEPVFAVIGVYNGLYDTYKDRIKLIKEFKEEVEEIEKDGKKIRTIRILEEPKLKVVGLNDIEEKNDKNKVIEDIISKVFSESSDKNIIIYNILGE